MSRSLIAKISNWLNPKDQERNLISATFHMINIALISMSLVGINWFTLSGGVCMPNLTLTMFFWFGYGTEDIQGTGNY